MFKDRRFRICARRELTKEPWTEWTRTDSYDEAVEQAKKAEAAGFEAKIIDKGVKTNVNDR